MRVQQLGHVVLKVRERGRSERFYTEVLGLQIAARRDTPPRRSSLWGTTMTSPSWRSERTLRTRLRTAPVCTMSLSRSATRSMIFAEPKRTSTRSASRSTRSRITRWRRASTSTTRTATRSRCTSIPPTSGAPTRERLRASPRLPSSKAFTESWPRRRYGTYQRYRASPSTRQTMSAGKRRRLWRPVLDGPRLARTGA